MTCRRKSCRLFPLAIAIVVSSPPAQSQTAEDARRIASDYSRRVIAADVDGVVARTNRVLIDKIGGQEKARSWLSDQYERLQSLGVFPIAETIGRIREYHDPAIDLFFVETTRQSDGFPKPVESTYVYIVDTKDKGRTWEVLDLGCADLRWLHEIAPSFHDDQMVSDILPR